MLRQLLIALWAITVLTLITVTVSSAAPGSSDVRKPGSQQQIGKPKFEDMKLQIGMGRSGAGQRGGGFQVRDQGG